MQDRWRCFWVVAGGMMIFGWDSLAVDRTDRLRQEGVIYVEDFLEKPLEVKVLRSTLLTFSRDISTFIDGVRSGQSVRVIGLAPEDPYHYLVRAWVSNGRAEGWVWSRDMEAIPEAVLKEIQQKNAEVERIKRAIARGEIEVGMPQEAVIKILGRPKAKSSIIEAGGSFEQWTYTTYKTVPFYFPAVVNGTNVVSTIYRKVPVGVKVITFKEKKVTRFETKQEDTTAYQSGQAMMSPVYVQ